MQNWREIFDKKAVEIYGTTDPSHDILHIRRVVASAVHLATAEKADINVVLPAAYFHDMVNVPKNDPRRKEASRLSADAAIEYLKSVNYPAQYFDAIRHAVMAHSFSANITCETLEAKVVQDADRLDSLGAVGIARTFCVNGLMGTAFYSEDDMLAETRAPDDKKFAIDHFFVKLFRVADSLQTEAGRAEGHRRAQFMRTFLAEMKDDVQAFKAA